MSKSSKSHGNGGNSWRDKRNYRRIYDESGNVVANIITVDGVDVEVTEEVFRAYSQMDRRERYQAESIPTDKRLSLDQLIEGGIQLTDVCDRRFIDVAEAYLDAEDTQEHQDDSKRLWKAVEALPDADRELIEALYTKGISIRKYAAMMGVSHVVIIRKRDRIIKTLKNFLR